MKYVRISLAGGLHILGFFLSLQPLALFSQGSLTPPGPPAPTMKSLTQIEPRIPISAPGYIITQPGAYYLTTNLVVGTGDGIDINTNGVTLDLGGFTIAAATNGSPYTAIGLASSSVTDVTIQNGHIVGNVTNNAGVYNGNGFQYGIVFYGPVSPSPPNVQVSHISVSGCLLHGILIGFVNPAVVDHCAVDTVGGAGIYAGTVSHSMARQCGNDGIDAVTVSDSAGYASGSGAGIYTTTAENCFGVSSSGYGIYASSTAVNCAGSTGTGTGLYVAESALNCSGVSTGGNGLYTACAQNCHGQSSGGGLGISATIAQNCYGGSGSNSGVYAAVALGCYGSSSSSDGVYAYELATGCYGTSSGGVGLYSPNASFCTGYRAGGTAIQAVVANGCYASGGTNVVTYKYNMP